MYSTSLKVKRITTLLVDDHPVVREGLRHLLTNTPDIHVIAEAGSGEASLILYKQYTPDVVILDLNMSGIGGLETIRRLKAIDMKARILIFSMHDGETMIMRAIEAGATGYLTKQNGMNQVMKAIRSVANREMFIDAAYVMSVAGRNISGARTEPLQTLSIREFQLFKLLAEGKTVVEIAGILSISPKTVGVHQTNIYKKLAIQNASQLVRLAIRYNVIEP